MNVLESLGFTLENFKSFGISGGNAVDLLGKDAVTDFITAMLSTAAGTSGNAADAFAFASEVDASLVSSGQSPIYTDYINQVNDILSQQGVSLDDLHYSIDPNGNVTGVLDGVSSTTININDLLAQAIAESGF